MMIEESDVQFLQRYLYELPCDLIVVRTEDCNDWGISTLDIIRIFDILVKHGSAVHFGDTGAILSTVKAKEHLKSAYYPNLFKQQKKELEEKTRKEEKEKYELRNAKWNHKVRWLPYVFSIISVAIAIIALIKSNK